MAKFIAMNLRAFRENQYAIQGVTVQAITTKGIPVLFTFVSIAVMLFNTSRKLSRNFENNTNFNVLLCCYSIFPFSDPLVFVVNGDQNFPQ